MAEFPISASNLSRTSFFGMEVYNTVAVFGFSAD